MTPVWIDTNVLLRFLTNEPRDQAKRARALMRRAEEGDVAIVVPAVVIAEVVWVMRSYYAYSATQVADALRPLVSATGVAVENADVVFDALGLMSEHGVDFADSYLAAAAGAHREPIATFDRDLRRLGAQLLTF